MEFVIDGAPGYYVLPSNNDGLTLNEYIGTYTKDDNNWHVYLFENKLF